MSVSEIASVHNSINIQEGESPRDINVEVDNNNQKIIIDGSDDHYSSETCFYEDILTDCWSIMAAFAAFAYFVTGFFLLRIR